MLSDMPATIFAHQALVLPLKMRWPRLFHGLALCIGSMAPDLEFIGRMSDDWLFSHTLAAQLYFSVPVTLALVLLLTRVVLPTVLPFVRDHPRLRLHDLAALRTPDGVRGWAVAAVSAFVGGVSHWALDGITHGGHSGWAVTYLPWLRTPVPSLGGLVPLHDALQLWLTVVLGTAGVLMCARILRERLLWQWRSLPPVALPRRARHHGERLAMGLAAAAVSGALFGHALRPDASPKLLAASVAFGAVDACLMALLLFAAVWQRRSPRGTLSPHAE
jgi:hypothetical protein